MAGGGLAPRTLSGTSLSELNGNCARNKLGFWINQQNQKGESASIGAPRRAGLSLAVSYHLRCSTSAGLSQPPKAVGQSAAPGVSKLPFTA